MPVPRAHGRGELRHFVGSYLLSPALVDAWRRNSDNSTRDCARAIRRPGPPGQSTLAAVPPTARQPRPRRPPGESMTATRDLVRDERDKFAFHDDIVYLHESGRGLTRETVEGISRFKGEPDWMTQFRLRAYDHFLKRPMPAWTEDLTDIDFDRIVYYRKPSEREEKSWD